MIDPGNFIAGSLLLIFADFKRSLIAFIYLIIFYFIKYKIEDLAEIKLIKYIFFFILLITSSALLNFSLPYLVGIRTDNWLASPMLYFSVPLISFIINLNKNNNNNNYLKRSLIEIFIIFPIWYIIILGLMLSVDWAHLNL